jgi:hypothetical protein
MSLQINLSGKCSKPSLGGFVFGPSRSGKTYAAQPQALPKHTQGEVDAFWRGFTAAIGLALVVSGIAVLAIFSYVTSLQSP